MGSNAAERDWRDPRSGTGATEGRAQGRGVGGVQDGNLHIDILHKLANWRIKGEDHEGAITCLLRLLDLDRTREDIHALLIKCFAKTGRRQEAFAQYRICCTALRQDLDQEPGHEIRELRAKLDAGDDLQ